MEKYKQSLDEYFERFLQGCHFHQGNVCVLDITEKQVENLGSFLVSSLCEWSTGGKFPSFDPVAGHKAPPITDFIDWRMKKRMTEKVEGAEILLKCSPEECQALGRYFASMFARWIEGLDREREIARKRHPALHARKTPRVERQSQPLIDLFATFVEDHRVIMEGIRILGLAFEAYGELGWRCLAVLGGWIDNRSLDDALRAM